MKACLEIVLVSFCLSRKPPESWGRVCSEAAELAQRNFSVSARAGYQPILKRIRPRCAVTIFLAEGLNKVPRALVPNCRAQLSSQRITQIVLCLVRLRVLLDKALVISRRIIARREANVYQGWNRSRDAEGLSQGLPWSIRYDLFVWLRLHRLRVVPGVLSGCRQCGH